VKMRRLGHRKIVSSPEPGLNPSKEGLSGTAVKIEA
jgi:hypothetical protein